MNTKTQTYSLEYVKAYGEETINKYNAFVEDNKDLKDLLNTQIALNRIKNET